MILTLLVPFNLIDGDAPLMEMFADHGFLAGKYIVAVGAVAGLTVSLLGSLFPMPRVIYAMAGDGLLFRYINYFQGKSVHSAAIFAMLSGSFFRHARPTSIYLNGKVQKSQKLTFK